MSKPLQDRVLHALCKNKTPVYIYLVTGIKLDGYIEDFDQFVLILRSQSTLMIYKHAVSSIIPQKKQSLSEIVAANNA